MLPAPGVGTTVYVEDLPSHLGSLCQVQDRVGDVFHLDDLAEWRQPLRRIARIILVHRRVDDSGGHSVETDTVFCIFHGETAHHGIQAAFGNHRKRGVYAGDGLVDERRRDAHDVPRSLLEHLFHGELSDIKKSEQIRRNQRVEVLGSKLRERLDNKNSGVVHQNIDGCEPRERRFDRFGRGFWSADIAIDRNQARCRGQ